MLQTSMAHGAWNTANMAQWDNPTWQSPHGMPDRAPNGAPMKLPAIGSERRQTMSSGLRSPTLAMAVTHGSRPTSWQDEIGASKPRHPKDFAGPLKPFDLDNMGLQKRPPRPYSVEALSGQSFKGRSSSTPAADAIKPHAFTTPSRLRHMSMTSSAGQQNPYEAARTSLRLMKPPMEFVPSSLSAPDELSEDAVAGAMQEYEDPFSEQLASIPGSEHARSTSVSYHDGSPSSQSRSSAPKLAEDPSTGHIKFPRETPRPSNMEAVRTLVAMPPRRPGSPDLDPTSSLEELAEHALRLSDPMSPSDSVDSASLAPALKNFHASDEVIRKQRERMDQLLRTSTPASALEAQKMGLSQYEYQLMRMRDVVRLTIPNSKFPFFNGNTVDDNIDNYPPEVQMAYFNPPHVPVTKYVVVTFKHHRAEVFVLPASLAFANPLKPAELVVVQADRGENVGQVWQICDSMTQAEEVARDLNTDQLNNLLSFTRHYVAHARALSPLTSNYKITQQPGWVIKRAESRYYTELQRKEHDEIKAKRIAAQKAQEMHFPLEILDTEFQIDHQKLTIYYISSEYVKFKELVNNIYKIYKMRIWMSSINPQQPSENYGFD